MASILPEEIFADLFEGSTKAYGWIDIPAQSSNGTKVQSQNHTEKRQITIEEYRRHLAGKLSIGVIPIEGNKCKFAAIDVDTYGNDNEINRVMRFVKQFNLPFYGFRSKSGGLHLYVFFDHWKDAATVQKRLRGVVATLGLGKSTEVFPKQTDATQSLGNYINLPLFGATRLPLNIEYFQPYTIEQHLTTLTRIDKVRGLQIPQAFELTLQIPCVGNILRAGIEEGERNETLFNLAVGVSKLTGWDVPQTMSEINALLNSPLNTPELFALCNSAMRGQYNFKHSQFKHYCIETLSGVNCPFKSNESILIEPGQMRQRRTDEPYYTWILNGQEIKFKNTSQLMDWKPFKIRIMETLGLRLNDNDRRMYENMVNEAFAKMLKEQVEDDNEASARIKQALQGFIKFQVHSKKTALDHRKVFYDEKEEEYHFRTLDLIKFSQTNSEFPSLSSIGSNDIDYTFLKLGVELSEHSHGVDIIRKIKKSDDFQHLQEDEELTKAEETNKWVDLFKEDKRNENY